MVKIFSCNDLIQSSKDSFFLENAYRDLLYLLQAAILSQCSFSEKKGRKYEVTSGLLKVFFDEYGQEQLHLISPKISLFQEAQTNMITNENILLQ